MKKKIALTAACIMIGVVMLVTTAFAGATGNSGYEAYKEALKKSFSTHSVATKLDAIVKDNGNVLAEASANIKTDFEAMSSSIAVKTKAQEKVIETYVQEEKTVIKDSANDTYFVVDHGKYENKYHDKSRMEKCDADGAKAGEAIVDALVGDLKNYFTLDERSDGSKDVAFQLSGSQIPSVINAVASIGIKEASKDGYKGYKHSSPFGNDINIEDIGLPKLVDDIRISNVDVKAHLSAENIIENQSMDLTVHGKDAAGVAHEVVVSMYMSFSGHGKTTPDTIDLTGKKVQVIDPKEYNKVDN